MQRKTMILACLCIGLLCLEVRQGVSAAEGKPPLQITVEKSASKDGPVVKLTVVNASDTYQIFQSISCSWQDFWQTNDKNTLIMGQGDCAKNSLYTVILAPGEKHAETASPLLFRGKAGKRTVRFGYSRRISNFTSAELKQIYNSPEKLTYFSRTDVASRFKAEKETFWSQTVTLEAAKQLLLP